MGRCGQPTLLRCNITWLGGMMATVVKFSRTIAQNHRYLVWKRILEDRMSFDYTHVKHDEYGEICNAVFEENLGNGTIMRILCTIYWWQMQIWNEDDPEFTFTFGVPDGVVNKLNEVFNAN